MKMRKKEVVKMLKEMQKTVYNSVMFEKAGPQQKWIIENLLGSAIAELDEYPYAIGLKNKNLIESKVVHPESEYDYVGELPLPCGTEVPMEVASDSRNNYSSLTRGFWLFVPIMAYSLMPLSL